MIQIARMTTPQTHPAQGPILAGRGAELAAAALAAVEAADAAFFQATPDSAALLAMLRPLTRRNER
jgi:hypothetical protein